MIAFAFYNALSKLSSSIFIGYVTKEIGPKNQAENTVNQREKQIYGTNCNNNNSSIKITANYSETLHSLQ
jgi:hypothetical protein